MSPRARARVTAIALAAAFAAGAAALFVEGDERGGSLAFFGAWALVHVLYGLVNGTFWALPIAVACPPLFVATASDPDGDTPLWLEALFVGAFYGLSFTFVGVVGRRLWHLRRPRALPEAERGEDTAE